MEFFTHENIKLPDVISSIVDFYYHEEITSKPNFVTFRNIEADTIYIASNIQAISPDDLNGKIVIKEAIEPGCDWLLLYPIAGVVTKYGGVASHIAIRCRELNIPAVIGCGSLFEIVKKSSKIKIDALNQKIYCEEESQL